MRGRDKGRRGREQGGGERETEMATEISMRVTERSEKGREGRQNPRVGEGGRNVPLTTLPVVVPTSSCPFTAAHDTQPGKPLPTHRTRLHPRCMISLDCRFSQRTKGAGLRLRGRRRAERPRKTSRAIFFVSTSHCRTVRAAGARRVLGPGRAH